MPKQQKDRKQSEKRELRGGEKKRARDQVGGFPSPEIRCSRSLGGDLPSTETGSEKGQGGE